MRCPVDYIKLYSQQAKSDQVSEAAERLESSMSLGKAEGVEFDWQVSTCEH